MYSKYAIKGTIAIFNENEDDKELARILRSDLFFSRTFVRVVRVKPEVLTMEEANKERLREEGNAFNSRKRWPKNLQK